MSRARTHALLALACGALLVPAGAAHAQSCAGADTPAVAGNEAQLGQAALCLLNQQRAAAGLPALTENAQLDRASAAYSRQMVAERFFDHLSPEGVGLVTRLTSVGYLPGTGRWNAGENIAWGQGPLATPQSIMTAWMNSAGHRANILSPAFADIGLGVAIGSPRGDTTATATYTTDFGHHVASSASLSPYEPSTPRRPATVVSVKARQRHAATARCARRAAAHRHGHASRACPAARSHTHRRTAGH